jgi:hypothetical protein
VDHFAMRFGILAVLLLTTILSAGCGAPGPSSGGEPKPLQGKRIPKGAGPQGK